MGGSVSSFWQRIFSSKRNDMRVLMVGLDAAGKTSILYKLRLGEVVTTIPTIGFNVETVEFSSKNKFVSFTSWDVGGRDKIRPLKRHYYKETNALVFVVDCNDQDRFPDAKKELWDVLKDFDDEDELAPLLVFANKQDLPKASSIAEVASDLDLNSLRGRPWYIQPSSALKGDGLFEGLSWLSGAMQKATKMESIESQTIVSEAKPVTHGSISKIASSEGVAESIADTESTADTEALEPELRSL